MAPPGKHETKPCQVCGRLYRQSRSDQIFCSNACGHRAWTARRQPTLTCPECGVDFIKRHGGQLFCSRACTVKADLKRRAARNVGGLGKGWALGRQVGPLNPYWKGDRAGYQAFHLRVYRERGRPFPCAQCGATAPELNYDWANLTGNYADVSDYAAMCRSCHRQYDRDRPDQSHERGSATPRRHRGSDVARLALESPEKV